MGQDPLRKPTIAKNHGAVGVITVKGPGYTTRTDDRPSLFEQSVAIWDRERTILDFHEDGGPLAIDLTDGAAAKLQDLLGIDFTAIKAKIAETKQPQSTKLAATFEADLKPEILERITTQNVVAFLEGSDPKLKEEIVAFGAHYDHVGMQTAPANASSSAAAKPADSPKVDRIFNGADDDGSGTVGILALAEAFATVNRPRRSLLFIWHAGEERGLWGSDYYVRYPTKPLEKIAALINIDMIGRNCDDKPENANHLFVIGANRTSKELRELVFKVNADRIRLDETDTGNFFMRSDHFHYARNRVPVAFFFTGVHKDYHKVTDEVQLILFDKMKKILDIIFECSLELANRDTRPAFTGEGF